MQGLQIHKSCKNYNDGWNDSHGVSVSAKNYGLFVPCVSCTLSLAVASGLVENVVNFIKKKYEVQEVV